MNGDKMMQLAHQAGMVEWFNSDKTDWLTYKNVEGLQPQLKESSMRYLSVCSGIEAATVAWHDLGWQPVGFSEIEPFPSAVLAHHYPGAPNLGDMTNYKEWNIGAIDLVVGGTPCQSFSVAGLRKGLEDPRGNLALVYCGILDHFRPQWCVWENVPGVLSSNGGRDFGSFLGALAELGYGFAYRVLDAQYFGVAQRRRRVFVVGHLGDWQPAAKVLFESESLRRDTAPSRQKGQAVAPSPVPGVANCLTNRMHKGINTTVDAGQTPIIVAQPGMKQTTYVAQPIAFQSVNFGGDASTDLSPTPRRVRPMAVMQPQGVAHPMVLMDQGDSVSEHVTPTLDKSKTPAVAHTLGTQCSGATEDGTGRGSPLVPSSMAVRRLTPVECERLQGFPDNYTAIPWRGKEAPDGPRYKALGNSMAVPVMQWIGGKINDREELIYAIDEFLEEKNSG